MPVLELLQEATAAVDFMERRWFTVWGDAGTIATPGLDLADGAVQLERTISGEIVELAEAIQFAHARYVSHETTPPRVTTRRGRRLLRALSTTLAPVTAEAAKLWPSHTQASQRVTLTNLREYLEDALRLLAQHEDFVDRVNPLGLAPGQTTSEALALELEAIVSWKASRAEAVAFLRLRNQLGTALHARLRALRAAARHVFRAHPDIVREVTSAYDRERRAKHRARSRALTSSEDAD